MITDKRYITVKQKLDEGKIRRFKHIFRYIPKRVVAEDMGIDPKTLTRRLRKPAQIEVGQIFNLSQCIGNRFETSWKLSELILNEPSLKEKRFKIKKSPGKTTRAQPKLL